MSSADIAFINTCKDILENGSWVKDEKVRPHWEDGEPAYTIKKFGVVNRYDLSKDFPLITIRPIAFKAAIDEILWIWQKKSNNINDLNSHIWDSWADENGSIGKAYGYQMGVKHKYREGEFDMVDRVLFDLKNNPCSRRIMTNLYTFADLHEMALYPCAYSMTFNVVDGKLCNTNKFRGKMEKCIGDYCQSVLKKYNTPDKSVIFLTHSHAEESMINSAREVLKAYGFENVYETTAGCTISSHCGKNTLGILYLNDGETL